MENSGRDISEFSLTAKCKHAVHPQSSWCAIFIAVANHIASLIRWQLC